MTRILTGHPTLDNGWKGSEILHQIKNSSPGTWYGQISFYLCSFSIKRICDICRPILGKTKVDLFIFVTNTNHLCFQLVTGYFVNGITHNVWWQINILSKVVCRNPFHSRHLFCQYIICKPAIERFATNRFRQLSAGDDGSQDYSRMRTLLRNMANMWNELLCRVIFLQEHIPVSQSRLMRSSHRLSLCVLCLLWKLPSCGTIILMEVRVQCGLSAAAVKWTIYWI